MMLRILVFLVVLLIPSNVLAWWSVTGNVTVRSDTVQVTMGNRWGRPIYCVLYAYGKTARGHRFQNRRSFTIRPGQSYYVNVYTDPNYDPFVDGYGSGRCRWR